MDDASGRAGLRGDEGVVEKAGRGRRRFGRGRRLENTARQAPAPGVDLGFDEDRPAEPFGDGAGVIRRRHGLAAGDRDPETGEQPLGLVFVRRRSSSGAWPSLPR